MLILVMSCRTGPVNGPNDGASVRRRTNSPGRRFVQLQLSKGSFEPFLLRLNPKLRCFDPKSSYFSQFKPRNIIKTYPSQILNQNIENQKQERRKKLKNPSSRTPQPPAVLAPKLKYFSVDFIVRYVGFH